MSSPAHVSFPAPVGGVGFSSDFAPSIIFILMYTALCPMVIYRLANKNSRTTLLINSAVYAIERIVWFSLRALQARNEGSRMSINLTSYMQASVSTGFISMTQDLVNLTRCLLVNATYGELVVPHNQVSLSGTTSQDLMGMSTVSHDPEAPSAVTGTGKEDNLRQRFGFRRYCRVVTLLTLVALVLGLVVGFDYTNKVTTSQSDANTVSTLRWISTIITLFLTISLVSTAVWARANLQHARRDAITHLIILSLLIFIICVYRLAVLGKKTHSLTASGSGTFNTPGEKAAFYIFHMLPEWIALAWLFANNTREIFGTGLYGDSSSSDK